MFTSRVVLLQLGFVAKEKRRDGEKHFIGGQPSSWQNLAGITCILTGLNSFILAFFFLGHLDTDVSTNCKDILY